MGRRLTKSEQMRSGAQDKLASAHKQAEVQSPPQTIQVQAETQQVDYPDLQTQLKTASQFGHKLADISTQASGSAPNLPVIQPKLTIGAPGDQYEQEADRVAQQVVQRLNSPQVEHSQPAQFIQRENTSQPIIQRTPLEDAVAQLPNKVARKKKNIASQLDTILNTILPLFLDRSSIAQDLTPVPKKGDLSQSEWNTQVAQANTQRFAEMPSLMARQRGLMNRLVERIHALRKNAEAINDNALVSKADQALRQAAILAVDFTQYLPSERSSLRDVADDFGVPVKMPNPIDPETYNAPTQFDAITATVSTFNPTAAPGQLAPQHGGADPGQVDANLNEVIVRLKDAYIHYLLQKEDYPGNLLGVFLGPEWFFGSGTPYSEKQKDYTINTLLDVSCQFPNMVIVPGTVRYSPDKKAVVNFAPVIYNGRLIRTIAKRFWGGDAPQNFIGMEHEKRQKFVSEESRLFNVGDVSFALDICQDTNVGIETAKKDYYSTLSPGNGVKVHLVTAGGAVPQQGSVATQPGGAVFGADAGGAARFYQTDPASTQANSVFHGQGFVATGSQVHRGNAPGATRDKEIKTTVNALNTVDEGGGLKHLIAPIPIGGLASENVTSMDIEQVESKYKHLGKPNKLTNEEERALLQGIQQYLVWFRDKPEKITMLSKMWVPIVTVESLNGPNVGLAKQLLQNLKQMRQNWINTLTGLAVGLPQLILQIRTDMNQYQQAQFSTSTGLLTPVTTNDITDWLIQQLSSLHQQVSGTAYTDCANIYQQVVGVFESICESTQDQVPDPAQQNTLKRYADTIHTNAEAAAKADKLLKSWRG
jgi:hypothetical protein